MKDGLGRLRSALPAWGDLREVSLLGGGNRNVVMLVERRGERFVAKSTRRSPEAIGWLQEVHDMARAAGFLVPRFVPTRDGREVVGDVTLESHINGAPLPHADLPRVAPLIREFHRLSRGHVQRPGFVSSLELLSADRGGDVDLSQMPEDLVAACRQAWGTLPPGEMSAIHGDLNPHNLILTSDDRIGLVDWDEARVDLPLFDEAALESVPPARHEPASDEAARALLAWEVAACWQVEPEHARRLAGKLAWPPG